MQNLHTACRSCGQIGLTPILSLGTTPLANRLLSADQLELEEPKYPLDLVVCPSCTLVQITETVPPEELFGEYAYFSSFSDSMLAHARTLAERVIRERKLTNRSLVIEIASNDGYLLQYYRQADVPVLLLVRPDRSGMPAALLEMVSGGRPELARANCCCTS